MNNIRNNIRKGFTVTPNDLINDDTLTPQARFLFVYMASKPDDWKFIQEPMAKGLGWSLPTLRKYLEELIDAGWISRERQRVDGKFDSFDYTLNPSPSAKNLHLDQVQKIPTWQNTNLVNFSTTNKDIQQTNTITKNSLSTESASDLKELDWMTVAQAMAEHAKGDGESQWAFMCDATGYAGEPLEIYSGWASKATAWQLQNWRDHFSKVQSWMKTAALMDRKLKKDDTTTQQPRNGRVQQQRPSQALPSPDEIRRQWGVLQPEELRGMGH